VDGFFRGILSVGQGVVDGVTGIVVEPVKSAREDGAVGFIRGVGKGLVGVVAKPMAGVVDFAGKTAEGIMNTPGSIIDAVKSRTMDRMELPDGTKFVVDPEIRQVFGVPLKETLYVYGQNHVIYVTLNYLANFLDEEGLFRLSGSKTSIEELRLIWDNVPPSVAPPFTLYSKPEEHIGCHEIGALLKLYLRTLPEPLLTFEKYPLFISALQTSQEERFKEIKSLIDSLPVPNRQVLASLLRFLYLASLQSSKNKMTASNLALIFGPCLLMDREMWRPADYLSSPKDRSERRNDPGSSSMGVQEILQNMVPIKHLVCTLIELYPALFPDLNTIPSPEAVAQTAAPVVQTSAEI